MANILLEFDPGEVAKFYVEPGDIVLKAGKDPKARGICDSLVPDTYGAQRETTLKSGEVKIFRILTTADGNIDIQRSEN